MGKIEKKFFRLYELKHLFQDWFDVWFDFLADARIKLYEMENVINRKTVSYDKRLFNDIIEELKNHGISIEYDELKLDFNAEYSSNIKKYTRDIVDKVIDKYTPIMSEKAKQLVAEEYGDKMKAITLFKDVEDEYYDLSSEFDITDDDAERIYNILTSHKANTYTDAWKIMR